MGEWEGGDALNDTVETMRAGVRERAGHKIVILYAGITLKATK